MKKFLAIIITFLSALCIGLSVTACEEGTGRDISRDIIYNEVTAEQWVDGISFLLSATNFTTEQTVVAVDNYGVGNYNTKIKIDSSNKTVFIQSRETFTEKDTESIGTNNVDIYYDFYDGASIKYENYGDGWDKKEPEYQTVESFMFKHYWSPLGDILARYKNEYASAEYDSNKKEYNFNGNNVQYIFAFKDDKLAKFVMKQYNDGEEDAYLYEYTLQFSDYGNTTVTIPSEVISSFTN